MSQKVLILGAGMVVQPMVDFLLDHDIQVSLASRTVEKAEKAIKNHANGKAIKWTIDELDKLTEMIVSHDLVVSLLPYIHHVKVAKICIEQCTNMLTTSYVSDDMKALHQKASEAGIIILNEIGVDPGLDHMTAMRIIDKVHEEGGRIEEFYSLCGALAAPEAVNNPLKYKFSWSPKGVVMAGNNDARYLENGREVHVPTEDLFKNPMLIDFPGIGQMEVYPNRDSLPYSDMYGIGEAKTVYRGTFRYKDWCEAFDIIKAMGLISYEVVDLQGKSYADFTADVSKTAVEHLKDSIAERYKISKNSPAIKALEFLGLLENKQIHLEKGSPFDIISDLMIERMMLGENERDMVIMQHIFKIINTQGRREQIKASLLDYGDDRYTSIAKTVAYPASIGAKLILDGKIDVKGVHIPIKREIYQPILKELKELGIKMKEEYSIHA